MGEEDLAREEVMQLASMLLDALQKLVVNEMRAELFR